MMARSAAIRLQGYAPFARALAARVAMQIWGYPPIKTCYEVAMMSAINLEALEAVGSYALQFIWNDGHSAGIYTWKYLHEACLGN